jgi:hypothetical protein
MLSNNFTRCERKRRGRRMAQLPNIQLLTNGKTIPFSGFNIFFFTIKELL